MLGSCPDNRDRPSSSATATPLSFLIKLFILSKDESQFGTQFTTVTGDSKRMISLVISSPRRSEGSFHGGAVHVYNIKR